MLQVDSRRSRLLIQLPGYQQQRRYRDSWQEVPPRERECRARPDRSLRRASQLRRLRPRKMQAFCAAKTVGRQRRPAVVLREAPPQALQTVRSN